MNGWRVKASLKPGKAGTRKAQELFPDTLFCVRYRYDGKGNRITTAEVIIESVRVIPKAAPEEMPGLSTLPKGQARKLLRQLGYAPHLSAKEKAKIVDKAEAIVRTLL